MIDFDFHIHCAPYSTCAKQTAEQAVQQAYEAGARVVAICNHNTVDGLSEVRNACNKRNMILVSGVELSVTLKAISNDLDGKVIHLLGYNFDLQKGPFAEYLKNMSEKYARKVLKVCNYLRDKGYDVKDCNSMKNLRIQLTDNGYFTNEKEAKKFLHSEEITARFPEDKVEPQTAIDLIHQSGGSIFWAHPNRAEGHVCLTKEQIAKIIDVLCEKGIDGLEVFHLDTVKEKGMVEYLLHIADEKHLKVSLGSDTHKLLNNQTEQYFILNNQLKSYDFDFEKIKNNLIAKLWKYV